MEKNRKISVYGSECNNQMGNVTIVYFLYWNFEKNVWILKIKISARNILFFMCENKRDLARIFLHPVETIIF